MGLAEPRKRLKLSHDPRNLQWSQDEKSFGARIMQSSGWKPGTALGASSVPVPANEASAAKVCIAVKDNTLGLGASLKSQSVEHQRTGLDAFTGLLGRLNAKDEQELRAVEVKIENKKLAMFAQGRWGGMVFVPGGLLLQEKPTTTIPEVLQDASRQTPEELSSDDEHEDTKITKAISKRQEDETPEQRAKRRAEKKQRKAERQARREGRRLRKSQKGTQSSSTSDAPELTETSTGASTPVQIPEVNMTTVVQAQLRNGRHILRGRNIQAKRLAFSDSRGLDQIFMRQQKQEA